QANVLSTRADGLGQVFRIDHDIHGMLVFVDHDGLDMGRRQGADDEFGGILGPQDDIDLFAAQLVAHRRHARTAHAHAGADGIDALVVRDHGNLGAYAGVAGGRLDFKQTLLDLGHFVLEQLADEFGRRARQNDLLAAGRMIDLVHPGADTVAHTDIFLGYHLAARQACFDLAGFDDGVALVHALDRAGHDVFAPLEEVVQDLFALGVADLLQDGLLG